MFDIGRFDPGLCLVDARFDLDKFQDVNTRSLCIPAWRQVEHDRSSFACNVVSSAISSKHFHDIRMAPTA